LGVYVGSSEATRNTDPPRAQIDGLPIGSEYRGKAAAFLQGETKEKDVSQWVA
jgi:hypothetical protein